jgi:hypothetical protein
MRQGIVRLVRLFGTQSDKDLFFHNLAKTGEVTAQRLQLCCACSAPGIISRSLCCVCSVAFACTFGGSRRSSGRARVALMRAIAGLLAPAHCFSKGGFQFRFALLDASAALFVTCCTGLDPLSRHHQNRARDDAPRQGRAFRPSRTPAIHQLLKKVCC